MKSILLATDFSDAAKNAADYAAQLSKITGSTLVIFHVWSLPAIGGETITIPLTLIDIEKDKDAAIVAEADRIEKAWGVHAAAYHKMGFAAEEIIAACKDHGSAIAVLGMRHHTKVGKIFGSVSTAFIHQNKIPGLIIPENVKFATPKITLLATDLHTQGDWHEIDALKELAKKMSMKIHILNVREKENVTAEEESRAGIRLESRLKDVSHSWHFHGDNNIAEAIAKTADEVSADWISVVPHRLPWAKQLFHSSVTNKLAFDASRPLLALPEREVHLG